MAKPYKSSIVPFDLQTSMYEVLKYAQDNKTRTWKKFVRKYGLSRYEYMRKLKDGEVKYNMFVPMCDALGFDYSFEVKELG